MKVLLFPILFISFFICNSQNVDVDVISEKTELGYTVKAINNTDVQRQFTVTLDVHNLNGYTKPIVKLVPAKTTIKLVDLTKVPNEYNTLKFKFSQKPKPTKDEAKAYEAQKIKKLMTDLGVSDNELVIFTKNACSKCDMLKSQLSEKKVSFKEINVTENPDANGLMWKLLRNSDPKIKSISMPVILKKGHLAYGDDDLTVFISSL